MCWRQWPIPVVGCHAHLEQCPPSRQGITTARVVFVQVKEAAKAYRVYYTKTTDDPDDYLVDHSIIMYLLDPKGQFMAFYGKNLDKAELADRISTAIT